VCGELLITLPKKQHYRNSGDRIQPERSIPIIKLVTAKFHASLEKPLNITAIPFCNLLERKYMCPPLEHQSTDHMARVYQIPREGYILGLNKIPQDRESGIIMELI